MANKTKILSDLSKIAVDAMSTFSGLKKEIETIVKIKVEKAINKLNLVNRDEFEALKAIVEEINSGSKTRKRNSKSKNKPKKNRKKK